MYFQAEDGKPKPDKTERKKNSDSPQEEPQQEKKLVKKGVTGTVKWFNVSLFLRKEVVLVGRDKLILKDFMVLNY